MERGDYLMSNPPPWKRYHPVINFLFRPVYKSLGGKYNPLVAENVTGLVSYAFHTGLVSLLNGGIEDFLQEGDLKKIGSAAAISLIFPPLHAWISLAKHYCLRKEKEKFRKELLQQGYNYEDIDLLVESEFRRRREAYAKTPKVYTGFESH